MIVGGTRGAGAAAVRLFRAEGRSVTVLARRLPPTSQRVPGVQYWAVDIRVAAQTQKVLRAIHRQQEKITGLVFFQRFRGEGDNWEGEIETSLTATKRIIDWLVEDFELKDCSIVVVSSVNAWLISKHLPLGYHIAKAGLNQLVRYYAVRLGPQKIRVNSISPITFLKDETKEYFLKDKALLDLYERMIPLGRMCLAEDVVQAVAFLCNRNASFVTGQNLVLDGGLTLTYQEALVRELICNPSAAAPTRTNRS